MKGYANKPVEELATQLSAGLARLRKGYVDAAEELLRIIDPAQEYPYELVVFRLTGFRSRGPQYPAIVIPGKTLRGDLLRLMLDVCDSFPLRTADYGQAAHDIRGLAVRLRVSTKTIQRWRRCGLAARHLVFPDGRRRLAFLDSSVAWFVHQRRREVERSARFSQMTEVERDFIIRRARRMAAFTRCTTRDVARRLAARTGRAIETIRYTIRRHDLENPGRAVFPYLSPPLAEQDRMVIYRCFLRGVQVPSLAQRYRRTRGSIYRIINEMRARQLMQRPIGFVYDPTFDLPNADELILSSGAGEARPDDGPRASPAPTGQAARVAPPPDLPAYLDALYETPLLDAASERDLFRRYNYLKYKADRLRRRIDVNRIHTARLRQIEALLLQANVVKNRIVRANLRLVVSIARKHLGGGPQSLFELISDGNISLLQAVEKFDYSRGNRFSTYASWAIMRNFARTVGRERYQLDRFATGQNEALDVLAGLKSYDPNEVNLPELRESIDAVLARLSPLERTILTDHFGLEKDGQARTLDQLGQHLGLSKERVRQIEIQALQKLRRMLALQETDLLS